VPVLVGADLYLAGVFAARHFAATVSILDDGFQHVQVERDIDLLLVSASDLNDRVAPAGRLREPLEAALLADALLVAGGEDDANRVAGALDRFQHALSVAHHDDALAFVASSIPAGENHRPLAALSQQPCECRDERRLAAPPHRQVTHADHAMRQTPAPSRARIPRTPQSRDARVGGAQRICERNPQ